MEFLNYTSQKPKKVDTHDKQFLSQRKSEHLAFWNLQTNISIEWISMYFNVCSYQQKLKIYPAQSYIQFLSFSNKW